MQGNKLTMFHCLNKCTPKVFCYPQFTGPFCHYKAEFLMSKENTAQLAEKILTERPTY